MNTLPKAFASESINLPLMARLILFVTWPLVSLSVLMVIALVLLGLWLIIPFKASLKMT